MSYNSTLAAIIFVVMLICAVIGAILWPYSINTWLVYFGKEPAIVAWQGAIIGFVPVVGQATIPVAFVTWVLMLFLV